MLTMEQARVLLEPFEATFGEIVFGAWERWQGNHQVLVDDPYKRTRATVIHNIMASDAKRLFAGVDEVHLIEEHESVMVCFNGQITVILKKLDDDLLPSSYPTPRQLDLWQQLELEGVPDCTRLVIGYRPNALGTNIEAHVVCLEGDHVEWSYGLNRNQGQELIPMPPQPQGDPPPEWNFQRPGGEKMRNEAKA